MSNEKPVANAITIYFQLSTIYYTPIIYYLLYINIARYWNFFEKEERGRETCYF